MNKEPQRAPLENGLKRALAGKGGPAEPMFVMSGPPNGQNSGDPEAHNQNDDDQDGPSLTQSHSSGGPDARLLQKSKPRISKPRSALRATSSVCLSSL